MKLHSRRWLLRAPLLAALGLQLLLQLPAQAASFFNTGAMTLGRVDNTMTLLPNGKVLVAGGYGPGASFPTNSAELYDPATGTWTATGSMNVARSFHTATLLPNGKVLVAGSSAIAELYDPATGTWTATGTMNNFHSVHTATLLADGRVLVAGGFPTPPEIYSPATGSWTTTAAPGIARDMHTATLLPNGKVLIVGGENSVNDPVVSAELYNPATGTWTNTGSLHFPRQNHSATLLPDGTVLVAAGSDNTNYLASAEIYNPATGTWTNTGSLNAARGYATATLLPGGSVLVAAGYPSPSPGAELFNPTSGTWTATASPGIDRYSHTATLLANARVLIAGGYNGSNTAEVYDPGGGSWSSVGPLKTARYAHTATLLPNGKALIAGGFGTSYLTNAELFDPVTLTNSFTGSLNIARGYHTATLLANGKVLLAGGTNSGGPLASAELYDPATGTNALTGSLATARSRHTATLLANGKVLVAGGSTTGATVLSSAEIYDPATGLWTATGSMTNSRCFHTATLLPNGKVFVAGGFNGSSALSVTEIYDPATGTWTTGSLLLPARYEHTATLLPGGKVLVAGGNIGGDFETSSSTIYDPGTGGWTSTLPLVAARFAHTATLLPNGKVLVAAGFGSLGLGDGPIGSVEIFDPATKLWSNFGSVLLSRYRHSTILLANGKVLTVGGFAGGALNGEAWFDVGLGFNAAWQPQIASLNSPLNLGDSLTVAGTKFRGVSEGATGNSKSSPADFPVVQLRSVESGQTKFLLSTNWSTNSFSSAPVTGMPRGYALATVFVNGIPGNSSFVNITANAIVTLGNLAQTYDGTARSVSAATTPSGLPVTVTYNGSPAPPTNAGSYTVIGTVADPAYLSAATNTLIIAKAAAPVILGNLSQLYNGMSHVPSVATVPPGLTVNLTYNGSIFAPINVGSYTVIGTIVETNYQGSATNTLVIGGAFFVNATNAGRIADARWFGLNTAIWDYFLDSGSTSNALRELGCLALRFPGGSLSDEYHWATGTTLENTWQWGTSFGNFMHVATNAGVSAFIIVNYGTGTTNEAADWVRSANLTNHCGFKYWEVGNECYGSWETDRNTNAPFHAHDPLTYATRFKDYFAAMKAADPTIKVGIVVTPGEDSYQTTNYVFNPRTGVAHFGWTPVLLDALHNLGVTPDFAVHHVYPEYMNDNDASLLQASFNWAGDAANLRQQIVDYIGTQGTNIELLVTENNADAGPQGKQSTSLVNGLYLADSLSHLMTTEFNAFLWWDLRNGADTGGSFSPSLYGWRTNGDLGIMLEDSTKYPTFYAMKLMQYFARPGDTILNPPNGESLLALSAARKPSGAVNVLVINKDPINTLTRPITLTGLVPDGVATLRSYGIPQDEAARTNASIAQQDVAVGTTAVSGSFSYAFPPYSLTLFNFAPAAPSLAILSGAPGDPFVFQIQGQPGVRYVIQTSTNLTQWASVSTNVFTGSTLNYTNVISPATAAEFWRVVWLP